MGALPRHGVRAGPFAAAPEANSVETGSIKDGEVGTGDLGATSVTAAKLGSDIITASTGLAGGNGSPISFAPTAMTAAVVDVATDSMVIIDANDSNAPRKEAIADLVDKIAGTAATTGLTDSSGTLVVAAKIAHVEAALTKGIASIHLSTESAAECGTFKVYFPMKVTINKIRTVVTKVIGITADVTITGANSTGNSANGVVTVAAAGAIGEEDTASPTTNNVVLADGYYSLTTAKGATYGGAVEAFLEYTVTA